MSASARPYISTRAANRHFNTEQRYFLCRGVKKTCRWHVFSLRPQRLCREEGSIELFGEVAILSLYRQRKYPKKAIKGKPKVSKLGFPLKSLSLNKLAPSGLAVFLRRKAVHSIQRTAMQMLGRVYHQVSNPKEPRGLGLASLGRVSKGNPT